MGLAPRLTHNVIALLSDMSFLSDISANEIGRA